MENNNLAKIMILDSTAAHGQYISKMFRNECVMMTSNFKPPILNEADKKATLIYVLSFYEELEELENLTKNHFRNVVVCSERMDDSLIRCSKPFAFVSLNSLKDKWMEEVLYALHTLNGEAVHSCFSADRAAYKILTLNNGDK
jgi:hypothetical protein